MPFYRFIQILLGFSTTSNVNNNYFSELYYISPTRSVCRLNLTEVPVFREGICYDGWLLWALGMDYPHYRPHMNQQK